ncbi:hypothetical protein NMY22_g9317 [Coprinellus aureogranulatus]|nr:hypothetical protein NMY22_g9317 [Coprinellus aureogranulatus]
MFWVASAPLSADGHVNVSPKGVAGTFHVESSTKVWYEDLSGSGAETIAHIRENGRVTILFNAFEGPPRILRLYGTGSFHEMGTPEYEALLPVGTRQPGSRAIVVVDVYKCGTTCGYSVPYYSFVGHRTPLLDWAARKEAIDLASSTVSAPPPSAGAHPKVATVFKFGAVWSYTPQDVAFSPRTGSEFAVAAIASCNSSVMGKGLHPVAAEGPFFSEFSPLTSSFLLITDGSQDSRKHVPIAVQTWCVTIVFFFYAGFTGGLYELLRRRQSHVVQAPKDIRAYHKSILVLVFTSAVALAAESLPTHYGVLLIPAFQALDVFGPLDVLNTFSFTQKNLTLSLLSRTLSPVTTVPLTMGTTFGESIVPTHTFDAPPSNLEVLLVPGGTGTRAPDLTKEVDFIRTIFPSLRYLIAVCTGNGLVARAGLLDGKKATGNKRAWSWVTAQGNKTHWVAQARWVRSSEKIWSTSGVSSGVDGVLNYMENVYGADVATDLAHGLEWRRVTDPSDDEFAAIWGAKDVLPLE